MKKIFINYSWKHDSENAEKLYDFLTNHRNNYEVWMDKKSMAGGLQWRPAIFKAIRESDFFIAILSLGSVSKRGVVNKEIRKAIEVLEEFPPNQVFIIPTRVEECETPFMELTGLNYVNLFPNWDKGLKSLIKTLDDSIINFTDDIKERPKNKKSKKAKTNGYHYKIGIVDLDDKIGNIEEVISQLNKIQNYFLFSLPKMPTLKVHIEKIDGFKNFNVSKVPKAYVQKNKHVDLDFITCITKYPLAFEDGDDTLYNYFSGESDDDERFMFVSTDQLKKFCKKAGIEKEEGLIYILTSQLIAYFTDTDFHNKTKGCALDFCEIRSDIIEGFMNRKLCENCNQRLPEGELKKAVMTLLNWKIENR